jgi:hypothetical protein
MIELRAAAIGERGIIEAVSAARHDTWLLAIENGTLPKSAQKQWMTQNDASVRPTHLMQQDQGPIPIADVYPIQGVDHPPSLDFGCRCWEVLVYDAEDLAIEQAKAAVDEASAQVLDVAELSVADVAASMRAEIATISENLDTELAAAQEESDSIRLTANNLTARLNSMSREEAYTPEAAAMMNQRREAWRLLDRANERIQVARRAAREEAHALLFTERAEFKPRIVEETKDPIRRKRLSEALTWLDKVVTGRSFLLEAGGEGRLRKLSLEAFRGTRSNAYGNTIAMSKRADIGTYIHEIGHWLERNPTVLARSVAFLESRSGSETARWLGSGYNRSEVAIFDKWMNPYTGKLYRRGGIGKWGVDATEILSMGLETLYRDPVGLAMKDPEFFDFLIGFLRGVE